jgi:hypothetical protein
MEHLVARKVAADELFKGSSRGIHIRRTGGLTA